MGNSNTSISIAAIGGALALTGGLIYRKFY